MVRRLLVGLLSSNAPKQSCFRWSRAFAKGPEIHKYLVDLATYFNLHPHIKYNQKVSKCQWNPDVFKWEVKTEDGSVYTANFVISACGQLHAPKIPNYNGKFKVFKVNGMEARVLFGNS